MNFITIAILFVKTYKALFNYLFAIRCIENGFFGLILIYFGIVETNVKRMFYLYYLIWLKNISNLFNFCRK